MKAPRFAYARPASVPEALALLDKHRDDARVLAGGQSLVPMLNFRVASPKVLVDINRIAALSGIKVAKTHVRIGALTRHVELERSPDIAKHLPLVASAMPHIAHPAIRNRGTSAGAARSPIPRPSCRPARSRSARPSSSPGRRASAGSPPGISSRASTRRRSKAASWSSPSNFPWPSPGPCRPSASSARRHGDYAMVGVAAHRPAKDGLRAAFFGVGDRPVVVEADSVDGILSKLDAGLKPRADLQASAETKLHLAKVLARRVLAQLA